MIQWLFSNFKYMKVKNGIKVIDKELRSRKVKIRGIGIFVSDILS